MERDADDLLLAEAFARVDLSRPRLVREWYLAHGAVALRLLFGDTERPIHWVGLHLTSQDTHTQVLAQQRLVRWHLTCAETPSYSFSRVPRWERQPDLGPAGTELGADRPG